MRIRFIKEALKQGQDDEILATVAMSMPPRVGETVVSVAKDRKYIVVRVEHCLPAFDGESVYADVYLDDDNRKIVNNVLSERKSERKSETFEVRCDLGSKACEASHTEA